MLSAHTAALTPMGRVGCSQAPLLCLPRNLSPSPQSATWVQHGLCSLGFTSCHSFGSSSRRKLTLCASFLSSTTPCTSVVKFLKTVALNILCSVIFFQWKNKSDIHYYFMVRTGSLASSLYIFVHLISFFKTPSHTMVSATWGLESYTHLLMIYWMRLKEPKKNEYNWWPKVFPTLCIYLFIFWRKMTQLGYFSE